MNLVRIYSSRSGVYKRLLFLIFVKIKQNLLRKMQQTLTKLALVAAAYSTMARAELKPGACPVHEQNKAPENFDKMSMAGLWFEYVWDQGFAQGYDYKCSTWIMLDDQEERGDGHYVIFNNMLAPAKSGNEGYDMDIIKFRMQWDQPTEAGQKAKLAYSRTDDNELWEDEEESGEVVEVEQKPDSIMQIIDTDYHQYAVGSTCHEIGEQHEESYFVWMREKEPSMYMRRKARNALIALGVEPSEDMLKGTLTDCWGPDILM